MGKHQACRPLHHFKCHQVHAIRTARNLAVGIGYARQVYCKHINRQRSPMHEVSDTRLASLASEWYSLPTQPQCRSAGRANETHEFNAVKTTPCSHTLLAKLAHPATRWHGSFDVMSFGMHGQHMSSDASHVHMLCHHIGACTTG